MPAPTKPQTACPTGIETVTYTEVTTMTLPGSDVVITLTATAITASTLFDYDYLIPATFQPTLAEPT